MDRAIALKSLEIAGGMVGLNIHTNPPELRHAISAYGFAGNPAFCSIGLGWCDMKAWSYTVGADIMEPGNWSEARRYIEEFCWPINPYVPTLWQEAQARGLAVTHKVGPLPGWRVVYAWPDGGHHIGVVTGYGAGYLHTIEFNTSLVSSLRPRGEEEYNGGWVARKVRNLDYVIGYVKTYA